jgi:hypothetical protein
MNMHDTKTRLAGVVFTAAMVLISGAAFTAMAQETETPKKVKRTVSSGRDPFKKYEAPRVIVKNQREESPIPSIQERINNYKAHP